ncbi:MAG: hypothetical protein Q8P83_00720 [bacterium]|nr:hypothetical protein [bacterium]
MNKKIVIIIFIVIVLLSFAAGTILLLSRDKGEVVEDSGPNISVSKLPSEPVISAISSFDSTAIWYFDKDARLYRINGDGTALSEFSLPAWPGKGDLINVEWPDTGNDFVALASSLSGTSKHYYNNLDNQYVIWPDNIQSFSWMPDGRRVIYIWQATDKTSQQLVMANADTSGFRIIRDVFWPDLEVYASPDGLEALLVRSKPEGEINKIYKADLSSGEFETIVDEGLNLDIQWLPDGQRFLFTQESPGVSHDVLLYNFTTRLRTDLNINTSLNKTVLDKTGNVLYAAVPKTEGLGDMFVKIDLTTFQQEVVYNPQDTITAKNLFLVNGDLYYVNVTDKNIYYIVD